MNEGKKIVSTKGKGIKMQETKFTSVQALLHFLESVKDKYYFRGYRNYDWHMRPSLGRGGNRFIQDEIKIIQEFAEISALEKLEMKVGNLQELLELGQLYGLPTRLLDWTTNPFVALYFALGEKDFDKSILSIAWISRDNPEITDDWSEINDIAPIQFTHSDWNSQILEVMDNLSLSEIDKLNGIITIELDESQKCEASELLTRVYRINKDETYPDPPNGSALDDVKKWCENKKNSYKPTG